MFKYTMQSTVSSQPPRQICTHFRLFCSPPPRESRVSGYSWRSQLCIGYITIHVTVFLVSTWNAGTGTMRKWPAQVSTVVANIVRELSLLRMAIDMANADYLSFFTPWPFRPKGYCRCLRLSVRKLYLVRTITHHRFGLKSPNLHQTCILGYSWLVLKMEVIDRDLQGLFGHFDLKF